MDSRLYIIFNVYLDLRHEDVDELERLGDAERVLHLVEGRQQRLRHHARLARQRQSR